MQQLCLIVVVLLNRGTKNGAGDVKAPQFFVLPANVVEAAVASSKSGWGKISWRHIEGFKDDENRWHLIEEFLSASEGT